VAGVGRREARERALSLLYEAESKQISPSELLLDLPVQPDQFVTTLVDGVGAERVELDRLISAHAIGWTIERMPVIDLMLLRMATFELIHLDDVPTAVVISEAVELAGQYSTDESGRFINGMLAKLAEVVRPPAAPGDT
jgi:N utilization substance protein B